MAIGAATATDTAIGLTAYLTAGYAGAYLTAVTIIISTASGAGAAYTINTNTAGTMTMQPAPATGTAIGLTAYLTAGYAGAYSVAGTIIISTASTTGTTHTAGTYQTGGTIIIGTANTTGGRLANTGTT